MKIKIKKMEIKNKIPSKESQLTKSFLKKKLNQLKILKKGMDFGISAYI